MLSSFRNREMTNGQLTIQAIGGPTAILGMGGMRLIVDPSFDPPGVYEREGGPTLTKTVGPAVPAAAVGRLDAGLVSHDHHADNLDHAGRELLRQIPTVLTTVAGAQRLGGTAHGVEPYERHDLERPDGGRLRATAVPAQHGPDGTDHLTGPVIGFVLSGDDLPTVYVSGDNASVDVVRSIVERLGTVDVALLNVGGARTGFLDNAYVTLSNERATEAARLLGARTIVPIHHDGWSHFTQDAASLRRAFEDAGLAERLRIVPLGTTIELSADMR